MTKSFSVRFDVDTHRCVRDGMPALIELGRELEAPFTFFVNMGRAVSRRAMVRRLLGGRSQGGPSDDSRPAAKLSAREKLGVAGYLWAAAANPEVGAGSPKVMLRAIQAGHEVGLHGGTNHATWQTDAHRWGPARLAAEVGAVHPALVAALDGRHPVGFASPGWSTHPALPDVLAAWGFTYLADLHGPPGHPASSSTRAGSTPPASTTQGSTPTATPPPVLPNLRTQLTGEPGGVAYLEHLRARGLGDAAIMERFEADLEASGDTVVMYDHPYFAGIREVPMLRRLIEFARGRGYEIVTLATVAERCRP